jgi:HEAT repeat protein
MAATIIWGSLLFAAGMTAIFSILVLRRWLSERRIRRVGAAVISATKSYLARIQGIETSPNPALSFADRIRLDAVLNLSRLLRGSERDRLMALADEDGMFDRALRDLALANTRRRTHAIELLDQFDSPKSIHALRVTMANDPVYELRLSAAFALARFGRLPPPRDTISQLSLIESENSRIHMALFRSLAPHHSRQLRELVGNPEYQPVKASVIDALGWSGDPACLTEIELAATDKAADIRCAALRAAGQLGHPQAGRWIVPLLDDHDENVRVQAIRCAARLSLAQALPQIERLASDPSSWVRWRADEALAALKPAQLRRQHL